MSRTGWRSRSTGAKKAPLGAILMLKTVSLSPRQAQDKHIGKSTANKRRFLQRREHDQPRRRVGALHQLLGRCGHDRGDLRAARRGNLWQEKTAFFWRCHFELKPNIYQDRLGTHMVKTQKRRPFFSSGIAALKPAFVENLQQWDDGCGKRPFLEPF